MTLETKLNLMKLKTRANAASAASFEKEAGGGGAIEMTTMGGNSDDEEEEKKSMKLEAMFNEDAEDSAESDSEIEV